MRAETRRLSALLAVTSFVVISCSSDVTQSDEYLNLQAELDDVAAAQAESESQTAEAESQLEAVQRELGDAEDRADSAESTVEELEAALEEEKRRIEPYPQLMADLFVEGCAEGDPGLEAACFCTIDELQNVITMVEFFEIAEVFAELELDPLTGEPVDSSFFQIEGAEVFFTTFFDCIFA